MKSTIGCRHNRSGQFLALSIAGRGIPAFQDSSELGSDLSFDCCCCLFQYIYLHPIEKNFDRLLKEYNRDLEVVLNSFNRKCVKDSSAVREYYRGCPSSFTVALSPDLKQPTKRIKDF